MASHLILAFIYHTSHGIKAFITTQNLIIHLIMLYHNLIIIHLNMLHHKLYHHIISHPLKEKTCELKIKCRNKANKYVIIQGIKITIMSSNPIVHLHCECLTYLATTQHLWHHARVCECMFIALTQ